MQSVLFRPSLTAFQVKYTSNAELLGRLKLRAKAVNNAQYHGPEFVRWVAQHVLEILRQRR